MQESEHPQPDWKVSWPLQSTTLGGKPVTVRVGVIETEDGEERVALQVAEEDRQVVVPLPLEEAALLLSVNLRLAISERLGMRHPPEGGEAR